MANQVPIIEVDAGRREPATPVVLFDASGNVLTSFGGTATAANQDTANTLLTGIKADLDAVVSDGSPVLCRANDFLNPSASFTRPANTTAYAQGQLMANSTTAGSVVPMQLTVMASAGGSCILTSALIKKSGTSVTNASFRLHLYATAPTPSNGDGGTWLTDNVANYICSFDVTMDRVFTDGAYGAGPRTTTTIPNKLLKLASGDKVYGLLEARAAYTPASGEIFTVQLEDAPN